MRSDWSGRRVLVTGGGGFLGLAIVEELTRRGAEVRTFSRAEYARLEELGVAQRRGDIRDADAVEQACHDVEVVFHTAAIAGIWGPWRTYHGVNTEGTQHVLAACQRHKVPRLIYTSSPSVTFDGGHQKSADETSGYPDSFLCHYSHSKALAEQAVLAANGRQGMAACALRPHLIWGPGDPHLIPRLINRARSGRLRRVGKGDNLVDMVFVDNAALAHVLAAEQLSTDSRVAGNAYFVSQGTPVNCWDWINSILALANLPAVKKSISLNTAWRVGGVLEAVYRTFGVRSEPPMTRFLAAQLAMSHYFSIENARRDFGYEPTVNTEDGMRRLASWIRDVGLDVA